MENIVKKNTDLNMENKMDKLALLESEHEKN